jgi:BirA family biotin operon repressor/biotin-[acetyl-CoA-carboxylase] ligase
MEIVSFESLPSTQLYLIDALNKKELEAPVLVLANEQSDGIGSRDNEWSGSRGDMFLSMAIQKHSLPTDLPLSAVAIYFAFFMKEVLACYNEEIFLKWPNDFYLGDDKIGGCVSKELKDDIVIGIGINLTPNSAGYKHLDIDVTPLKLAQEFINEWMMIPSWKYIFSKYQVEFGLSKKFDVHIDGEKKSLENAQLFSDGSIEIDNKKVFSVR